MARTRWTEEKVREVVSTCVTQSDLYSHHPGAYSWLARNKLLDDPRFSLERSHKMKWTDASLRSEAAKYRSRVAFSRGSAGAYVAAINMGIVNALFLGREKVWTDAELIDEASKYLTKAEFRKGNVVAFNRCCRVGLLDTIFTNSIRRWDTESSVIEEASRYATKNEFRIKGGSGAYQAALRMGILNSLGFKPGRYGYDSSKPGYIYICDLRLTDLNDGVMFGVTNQGSRKRYHPADRAHISNFTSYLFLDGAQALAIETELKRRFLAKKITSKQSPLSTKKGTSGEIVTGVQRSIVEVALLDINSKFDGVEHW